jgi:uncharacterized protein (UPF0335 family)
MTLGAALKKLCLLGKQLKLAHEELARLESENKQLRGDLNDVINELKMNLKRLKMLLEV